MTHLDPNLWINNTQQNINAKGGGSAPAGETTTTSKSEPWAGQQPFLTQGFSEAQRLYQSGGPQYFPNSTVAPQSDATQMAIQGEIARGLQGDPAANAASNAAVRQLDPSALVANPGNLGYMAAGQAQNPALGLAAQQAMFGPAGSQTLNQVAQSGVPNYAQGYLGNIAAGNQLANPYLQQQWAGIQNDVGNTFQSVTAPQLTGAMAGAGRFGSGMNAMTQGNAQRALSSQLANAGANLFGNAYEQAAGRQLSAAGQIQNAAQADVAARTGAAQQLGNLGLAATNQYGQLGQQAIANQLAAAQGVSQNYAQAAQNQLGWGQLSPALAQESVKNLALIQDAGSQIDAFNQANINDQIARWNYQQTQPYQALQNYMGTIQGNYGNTNTVTQPYYQQKGASQLGGALSGAASGAAMGSMVYPGIGTAVGAVGGGLMGAFA